MTASPITDRPERAVVRKAGADDVGAMVEVLTRAFDDDPVINWFVRQDAGREDSFRRFFEVAVRALTLPLGEVYTTSDVSGAALWAPPGTWQLGPDDVHALLPDFTAAFGDDKLERSLEGIAAMDAVHPQDPHFYLLLLGVLPELQGHGVGSALLRAVLARCDEEGLPAYLEATSPRNRSLYERHGFEVASTLTLPGGGPPVWLMWRAPQPVAGQRRRTGIDLDHLASTPSAPR